MWVFGVMFDRKCLLWLYILGDHGLATKVYYFKIVCFVLFHECWVYLTLNAEGTLRTILGTKP